VTLDAIYVDRLLTSLYDSFNPLGADTDFYLSLPVAGSAILDIGCGTGLLAAELARKGHEVIGLDPAAAMLDIARTRAGGERVRWVEADARAFDLEQAFDLILMTGHVFQIFLEDDDVLDVFRCAKRHLKTGGRLVFESRNPAAREWERWTPEQSRKTIEHPLLGRVVSWHSLTDVKPGVVSFSSLVLVEGETVPVVSHSNLAFRSQSEIEALLEAVGFANRHWSGDWNGAPLAADSPEIIVVAR
jgi:SAM-dependent methyltransferase